MFISQAEIAPYAAADPVKGLVVQGLFAGYAPDTVRSKEFFRHSERLGLPLKGSEAEQS